MENTAITIISYIDTMQEKTKLIYDDINKASTVPEIVDHIAEVKPVLSSLDQYLMLLVQSVNEMVTKYQSIINTISEERLQLQTRLIEKHVSVSMQPNMTDTFYDENLLLSEFDFKSMYLDEKSDFHDNINMSNIEIIELTDQKDYSCIGLLKRFESEKDILLKISQVLNLFFDKNFTFLNDFMKPNVLELKTKLSDIEFLEDLCTDSTEGTNHIVEIDAFLKHANESMEFMKKDITKVHQLLIALINNYKIYSKVIDRYTSLTVEHFLNKNKPYEIC